MLAQNPTPRIYGKGAPFTVEELPEGILKKQLKELNPKARDKALAWLHELKFEAFDAEDHLRVDKDGGVFIVCPGGDGGCKGCKNHNHDAEATPVVPAEETVEKSEPVTSGASVPVDSPPAYNSKPGAPYHIYMDFNGAYVTGKAWSESDGTTTWTTWDCHPWRSDGDRTTFSDSEQTSIRYIGYCINYAAALLLPTT